MSGMKLKKALIVYNKPLHQLHILETKDPHYLRLLRGRHVTTKNWRAVHDEHQRTLEGVQRTLSLLGIETDILFRKKLKKVGNYDMVITVGGDGTFLETSHYLDKQAILGVNAAPVDSTGALCHTRMENFLSVMIDLLTGDLKPMPIPRLKIKIGKKTLPTLAVNDVLFANHSPAGTSRYLIRTEKQREEHKSSGVWVSTGTGSTAAIRSAGGIPLAPTRRCLQYVVREVIPSPEKKFKLLKGILPKGKKLRFISKMRQGAVFIDGNHIEIPVPYGETVEIGSDGTPLRAIL
jgi:NAD+ kinase